MDGNPPHSTARYLLIKMYFKDGLNTKFVIYVDVLHFFVKCIQTCTGFAAKLDG